MVGLDILGGLDRLECEFICEFIYSLQVPTRVSDLFPSYAGFLGSPYLGISNSDAIINGELINFDEVLHQGLLLKHAQGHLAMTYTALATLVTLGDNLARVEKNKIVQGTE